MTDRPTTPTSCSMCGLADCPGPHLCLGAVKLARLRAALTEHAADLAAQAADEEGLPDLLRCADETQMAEIVEYLCMSHDASTSDILDAWDDAGPVQRVVVLTILGVH